MKTERLSSLARLMVVGAVVAVSLNATAVTLPAKEKFKIVVLAGQSNMAGRGKIDPSNNKAHPRVLMLNRKGEWVPCVDPVHFDVDNSGVGPGKAFGEALADSDPSITVGLVPCAVGGSSISVWEPGKEFQKGKTKWHPYDDMVERVKKAKESGTLTAILWHQGETDAAKATSEQLAEYYPRDFKAMVEAVRREIGDVPVIVGEIGRWMRKDGDHATKINPVIDALPKTVPNCAVASSEGLTNQDAHHFDREGQRVLATRYYEEFKKCATR